MTPWRAAIGAIWLVSFLTGRDLGVSEDASSFAASSAEITDFPVTYSGEVDGGSAVEPDDPAANAPSRVDLIGNEIEDAVADYRVDVRGSVYERHSPDTAVQRLGSPTT